jgi:hypothetical protein
MHVKLVMLIKSGNATKHVLIIVFGILNQPGQSRCAVVEWAGKIGDQVFKHIKSAFTAGGFLTFFARTLPERTVLGMCNR